MSSIVLDVTEGDNRWIIPLERRITIVRGDSGVGKTGIVDAILEQSQATIVDCELEVVVVNNTNWKYTMTGSRESLIIFDDMPVVATHDFAELVKQTVDNGNYYLLFSRELVGTDDLSQLNISVNSIIEMYHENEGRTHLTRLYFDIPNLDTDNISVNKIIVEDKKAGKMFFESLYGDDYVESAENGKSNIAVKTLGMLDKNENIIIVLPDMAAYGAYMDEFYDLVLEPYEDRVFIELSYECFEEMLVNTNYLIGNEIVSKELSNIKEYANKYISWEAYYEDLLYRVTKGTKLHHAHNSRLKYCWRGNCDKCTQKEKEGCTNIVNGDKMQYLLDNTKYEKFLRVKLGS